MFDLLSISIASELYVCWLLSITSHFVLSLKQSFFKHYISQDKNQTNVHFITYFRKTVLTDSRICLLALQSKSINIPSEVLNFSNVLNVHPSILLAMAIWISSEAKSRTTFTCSRNISLSRIFPFGYLYYSLYHMYQNNSTHELTSHNSVLKNSWSIGISNYWCSCLSFSSLN